MIFDNEVLYDDGKHKFIMLGTDISGEEGIPVNQFLVIDGNEAILLDPGGAHVFATVLANVSEIIDPTMLTGLFYSHQDPDVTSGIMMWLNVSERAKVYISELWIRFLPHFGVYDANRVIGIPDKGMDLRFSSGNVLHVIPAHYLHSPGMFTLYDPVSKILFSSDIGASVLPSGTKSRKVEDFEWHLKNAISEAFHRRYMASNVACRKWVSLVRKYDIEWLVPQHGAIYPREMAQKFLSWLENLRCGSDIIDEVYGR